MWLSPLPQHSHSTDSECTQFLARESTTLLSLLLQHFHCYTTADIPINYCSKSNILLYLCEFQLGYTDFTVI